MLPFFRPTKHYERKTPRQKTSTPASSYRGVLLDVKPAHVREEESSRGVVWVRVLLRVLVVNTVITRPVVDGALVGHRVDEHHEHPNGPMRVVRTVRPQSVDTPSDPETTVVTGVGRRRGGGRGGRGRGQGFPQSLSSMIKGGVPRPPLPILQRNLKKLCAYLLHRPPELRLGALRTTTASFNQLVPAACTLLEGYHVHAADTERVSTQGS